MAKDTQIAIFGGDFTGLILSFLREQYSFFYPLTEAFSPSSR